MKKSFLIHIIFLLAFTSLSSRNFSSGVATASEPDMLEIQWSYSIGCEDRGGPAVGPDGAIYVGGHSGYIHAVNSDGTKKWKRFFPVTLPEEEAIDGIPVSIRDAIPKGFDLETMPPMVWHPMEDERKHDDFFRMIPTISDDTTLYLAGRRSGKIYALSTADGSITWEFDVRILKEVQADTKHYGGGFEASPVIGKDGTIYCASGDTWGDQWVGAKELGVDVGKIKRRRFSDRRLYAMNPDGTLKWIFTVEPTDKYRTSLVASPAIGADGTIYVGNNDSCLHAFNPDGTHKWKFKTNGEIPDSPVIGPDSSVYFACEDKRIYAIDTETGRLRWIFRAQSHPGEGESRASNYGSFFCDPAVLANGHIVAATFSGHVYCLRDNGASAEKVWDYGLIDYNAAGYPETRQFHQEIWGSPAIDADGTIYIGSNAGKVHVLDPKTGKLKWESERTGGEIFGAPVIGINGEIYVGAEDHYLYVYQSPVSAISTVVTPLARYFWKDRWPNGGTVLANGEVVFGGEQGNRYISLKLVDGKLIKQWESDPVGQTGEKEAKTEPLIDPVTCTIYVSGGHSGGLYALKGTQPMADTPWPKVQRDIRNSGRAMAR